MSFVDTWNYIQKKLIADQIIDKNGHILPYVRFEGGHLDITPEALEALDAESKRLGTRPC